MSLITEHLTHLRRRGLADGTITTRRHKLAALDAYVPLERATTEHIERFLDDRKLSAKTRYDWISHLRNFFQWAIDHEHLDRDPTARLAKPRLRRHLPRPISDGDLATALDMASPMMRGWLTLAAFAGLRCMEIAGLEVDDILWSDGLLRVIGKGDKERLIPMHPQVEAELRGMVLPKRGKVFRRPRGGGFPPAQVSREISLYLEGISIPATAHQLRHWFATNVYRQSHDLRVTQELLGHASPTTTAVYADWSRAEAKRAVGALGAPAGDDQQNLLSDWAS